MSQQVDYDHCIGKKEEVFTVAHFFDSDDESTSFTPETVEDAEDWYKKANRAWKGMPEFENNSVEVYNSILVNILTEEDAKAFSKLIDQTITKKTKSVWFPKRNNVSELDKFWVDDSGEESV